MRLKPAAVAVLTTLSVFVAGCGSGSSATASSSDLVAPAATSTAAVSTASVSNTPSASAPMSSSAASVAASPPSSISVAATSPKRIVSLSPSATEDLYAIGAGAQVVAVDSLSDYPTDAPVTKLSAYEPNAEAVAKYQPDLVVISDDVNNIKAQLTKLSIPVIVEPAAANLADVYAQITSLGTATGHQSEAARTVAGMQTQVATLVAGVPQRARPLTYFHELDNTLYSASSKTFVGQLYAMAGLKSIADADNPKATPYPQLSAEYLVKADPDLVFLADTKCCQQTLATFAARPGFSVLTAVKTDNVVLLDDDVASRWGPRVVDLLQKIVTAVKSYRSS